MNKFSLLLSMFLLYSWVALAQLGDITGVTLTFTPETGSPVIATASDNGSGLQADGAITLMESTPYNLSFSIQLGTTDVTNEISANANDYQAFFAPMGSILSGDVTAVDSDAQGLPIGLDNEFTTECTEDSDVSGMLRFVLADLTGMKMASSAIGDGTTLLDVNWMVTIEDDPNAPPCENEEEIITDVILTWTPANGGTPVVARAQDPDGEGPQDLQVLDEIDLSESTDYTLTIELTNAIEGEDITEEIMEEDDEHMFFFAFTDEVFASPAGDGNADNRQDPVGYNDFDENGLPVGLSTNWTTECGEETTSGTIRVVLKHQPDIKSATSTINDGGTDVDLTFNINVNEDPDAPPCENEEEIITDVILTWTPANGGTPVVARAQDPDGEGPQDLQVLDEIDLSESTDYTLTIELTNAIEGEDITEEIMEEDDEHQFFFEFTDEIFRSPAGDGNADNRDDAVNYNDFDENGLPVGLSTDWTTECEEETTSGIFRVVLKHQPDIKDENSTIDDGGTDVDLTFNINVLEDPDAPPCENEEETITDVILTWTPVDGGDPVVARAQDPDGEGPQDLEILDEINLSESTDYTLTIELLNAIEGEDITEEIMEEDDEHQFFFEFTDEIFGSPAGNGNADNRDDPINYNDFDENGLPVGLSTSWTTECGEETTSGTFRVVLKHQPGIKDETSDINSGGTDIDLTFDINVLEDPNAPPCENEEEIITDVILTWTPMGGGEPIVARAQDPDGEGPQDLEILDDIQLFENVEYTLAIELTNAIEGEDITEEIMEEDDEHMFFFAFTDEVFESPMGDGNADDRDDPVNYIDFDENGLPVGLFTAWTTASATQEGTFRVVLKHQPDIKDENTTIEDGGTDVDLTWPIRVVEDPNAADIDVSITASQESVDRFNFFSLEVTVTNNGPGDASDVVVEVPLPENVVFAGRADFTRGFYTQFGNQRWTINDFPAGQTSTLTLDLFTLTDEEIVGSATLLASSPFDNIMDNNSASVTLNGDDGDGGDETDADVSVLVDADQTRYSIFSQVTFTVTVSNDGPGTAADVMVDVPTAIAGTVYTGAATVSQGTYTQFADQIWSVGDLASGASATLSVTLFTLSDNDPITVMATASTTSNDPDASNDSSSITILPGAAFNNSTLFGTEAASVAVYPNPTTDLLTVSFVSDKDASSVAYVMDIAGRVVMTRALKLVEGYNEMSFDATNLSEGYYFVAFEGSTVKLPFVKQ